MNPEVPHGPEFFSEEQPDQSDQSKEKPQDLQEREESILLRVAKSPKAKRIARVLVLLTALAGGGVAVREYRTHLEESARYEMGAQSYRRDDLLAGQVPPEQVFKNFQSFSSKPWAKEALRIAIYQDEKAAFEKAPEYLKHFSPEEAQKFMSDLAENNADAALASFSTYRNFLARPKDLLSSIVARDVWANSLVKYADAYRELPDAEAIFQKAASSAGSDSFLERPEGYSSYKNADSYLEKAAKSAAEVDPSSFLRRADKLAGQPWTARLVQQAVDKDAISGLEFADKYSFLREAGSLRRQAFSATVEKMQRGYLESSLALIRGYKNYQDYQEAESILRSSFDAVLRNPEAPYIDIISGVKNFLDRPWVVDYLRRAIEINPLRGIESFASYEPLPQAEELLKKSVELRRRQTTREGDTREQDRNEYYYRELLEFGGDKLVKYSWGAQIIREALERNSFLAIKHFEKYQNLPDSRQILERAFVKVLETVGSEVIWKSNASYKYDWAFPYLQKAALHSPTPFLKAMAHRNIVAPKYRELIKEAAQASDQWELLASGDFLLKIDREWAVRLLADSATAYKDYTLANAENFRGHPKHTELVLQAARDLTSFNPGFALRNFKSYKDLPQGEEIVRKALQESAERDSAAVFATAKNLAFLSEAEIKRSVETAAQGNPVPLVGYISYESNGPKTRELLVKILSESSDMELKKFAGITTSRDYLTSNQRMRAMLIALNEKALSADELVRVSADERQVLEKFITIKKQPNAKAQEGVESELRYLCLHILRSLNALHDEPSQKRFARVKTFGAEELYYLIIQGEEEAYTSTFNGLFDRLQAKTTAQKLSGFELLQKVGQEKFRSFIKLCAQYHRLPEFLATTSSGEQEKLLGEFVQGLETYRDYLDQAVAVADTFSAVQEQKVLRILQEKIKQEYDRVSREEDRRGKAIYGLLAGMFAKKAVINEEWIREIAEQYSLPDIIELPAKKLFNKDGSNIQEHFFYNDKDGHASFTSFLAQYRSDPNWQVEDKGKFIIITSRTGGGRVEIFANKPDAEDEGIKEIDKALRDRQIESIVVVHRGHSYHASKTISRIPKIATIVSLGSCGGYNNVGAVLDRAPEAHIISTKGVGTMTVNDPVLKMLNEEIRLARDLNWRKFWDRAQQRFGRNKDFSNYIPPHKNLGVLFMKAYRQKVDEL